MSKKTTKPIKRYPFIDKEGLRKSSGHIDPLMEKMEASFYEFGEYLKAIRENTFVEFSYLMSRAGLSQKLIEKTEKALEKFRTLYFELLADIRQTRIGDYT